MQTRCAGLDVSTISTVLIKHAVVRKKSEDKCRHMRLPMEIEGFRAKVHHDSATSISRCTYSYHTHPIDTESVWTL